jgi:hypothetical protein
VTQTTRDTGSGKSLRRLPRPCLLSVALGAAGLAVIAAGLFLHGSAPAVDPTAPQGYGPLTSPASAPATSPAMPGIAAGNPDGGLLPGPSVPETGVASLAPIPVPAVPVTSGALTDLEGAMPAEPVRLVIPALGIDAPIRPVGVDNGEMEVPPTAQVVAWYRFGPTPGHRGSAVLAAHVSWGGELGVFYHLRNLPPGAEIEVHFADSSVRRFYSVALTAYDKTNLPVEQIFAREGEPVLTLITCGGNFNPSIRRFEQNVVVYARPVQGMDGQPFTPSGAEDPS